MYVYVYTYYASYNLVVLIAVLKYIHVLLYIYIIYIIKFMGVKPAIFQWSRLAQDLQEAPQGFGDPRTCGACG